MELYLIRHGETLFNKLGYTQGWCDSPLTELGIQQAQKACQLLEGINIDYAFSSTSERAYDTCRIALGDRNLTINKEKRIKELNFGVFEGSPDVYKMHFSHNVNPVKDRFFYEDLTPVGGENSDMMLKRFNSFVDEIYKEYKDNTVLLSSHGVALTAFVLNHCKEQLNDLYGDRFFFAKNAALTKIIIDEDGYHLIYANKED